MGRKGSKGRGPAKGGGRRGPAPRLGYAKEDVDSEEEGELRIGGVLLKVDGSGNVRSGYRQGGASGGGAPAAAAPPGGRRRPQPKQAPQQQRAASGSESGEEESEREDLELAIQDYLDNLEAGSSGTGSDGDAGGSGSSAGGGGSSGRKRRRGVQDLELLRRFSQFQMEDEGPVTGLGWAGSSSDDEEESSSSSSSGSDWGDTSSEAGSEGGGSGAAGVFTSEEMAQLSLAQRFPVQVRPQAIVLPGQQQAAKEQKKRKGKAGARGAQGGKLAPGEKKRLRKERMEAKRSARAAGRGFDLSGVNSELEKFVLAQGDLKTFGPLGKHECKAVQRLAALYGCHASVQGGSGKRKLVVVATTNRTALPQGPELLRVGQLLTAQSAAELAGVAFDGRLAAAAAGTDLFSALPSTGRGRWAGLKRSGGSSAPGSKARGGSKQRQQQQFVVGAGTALRPHSRPVAFVSSGVVDPDESVEVLLSTSAPAGTWGPVTTAASAAAAAAAAALGAAMSEDEIEVELAVPAAAVPAAAATWPASMQEQEEQQQQQQQGAASMLLVEEPPAQKQQQQVSDAADAPMQQQQQEGADAMLPAEEAAAPLQQQAAGAVQVQLLEVVEDLGGSGSDGYEPTSDVETSHPGLGSSGAAGLQYTRLSSLPLPPPGGGGGTLRGSLAAEGLTNPGRLLALGLALGIGAEVFGAPGVSAGGAEDAGADLSALSPLLSKSQQRKLQRRGRRGGAAAPPAALSPALLASSYDRGGGASGWQQHQAAAAGSGRRQGKPGRTKEQRRGRDAAAAAAEPSPAELELELPGGFTQGGLVSGDYGDFERHTTGIGSKLLAKWGFGGAGSGLGRSQQGRAEPLHAVRRAKGVGLGAER